MNQQVEVAGTWPWKVILWDDIWFEHRFARLWKSASIVWVRECTVSLHTHWSSYNFSVAKIEATSQPSTRGFSLRRRFGRHHCLLQTIPLSGQQFLVHRRWVLDPVVNRIYQSFSFLWLCRSVLSQERKLKTIGSWSIWRPQLSCLILTSPMKTPCSPRPHQHAANLTDVVVRTRSLLKHVETKWWSATGISYSRRILCYSLFELMEVWRGQNQVGGCSLALARSLTCLFVLAVSSFMAKISNWQHVCPWEHPNWLTVPSSWNAYGDLQSLKCALADHDTLHFRYVRCWDGWVRFV